MFDRAAFPIRMPHDNDVAPTAMHVTRKHHDSISDAVNRISEVRIAPTHSIPIFALVTTGPVAARLVVALGIRLAHGEIKTVRQLG